MIPAHRIDVRRGFKPGRFAEALCPSVDASELSPAPAAAPR